MTGQFLQERVYLKGVSPKTVIAYGCAFKAFEGALESKQTILDRVIVLKERKVSNTSINCYLRHVNAYFRWLHLEHGKPLIKIPKLKEEQKVIETLNAGQVQTLVRYRPKRTNETRAHVAALVMLDCGLRASELLNLKASDVDLDNLVLKVLGKGNKQRLVPISLEGRKNLFRRLRTLPSRDHYLFATSSGSMLTVRNFERDLKALGRKLNITGVRFSPHTFRHSFATGYLRNGGNIYYLSKILGHTSVKTTECYLRSLGVEDLKAVHNGLTALVTQRV